MDLVTRLMTLVYDKTILQSNYNLQDVYKDFSAFYYNDYEMIQGVIRKQLKKKREFTEETLRNMYFTHIDLIQKYLDRKTAGIYDKYPKRLLTNKNGDKKDISDLLTTLQWHNKIIDAFRKAIYYNVVIALPVIRDGENEIDIITPDNFSVETKKNYNNIKNIIISRVGEDGNIYGAYYSETEHYIIDMDGNKISIDGKSYENKLGIMPVVLRINEGLDFYGEPDWDIFMNNIFFDLKLTDMDKAESLHTYPVGIGINLGEKVRVGAGEFINVNNSRGDILAPDLKYPSPNIAWSEVRENINFRQKLLYMAKGLPNTSTSIDIQQQSGRAKEIDEIELEEKRNHYRNILWDFERRLYKEVIKLGLPAGELDAVFDKAKVFETPNDKKIRWQTLKEYGVADEIDFIMEHYEVGEEEAEKIFINLKDRAQRLGLGKKTTLQELTDKIYNETL